MKTLKIYLVHDKNYLFSYKSLIFNKLYKDIAYLLSLLYF